MNPPVNERICIALTGASGSVLAEKLFSELLPRVERIYLVASKMGLAVAHHELEGRESSLLLALQSQKWREEHPNVRCFRNNDFFSPLASGSSAATQMVIVPCSMGTLARIYTGQSNSLIERAADVMLKEGRKLVICPREAPLSTLHLRNMYGLAKFGAMMIPPVLSFYQKPESVEDMVNFVVGRILDALQIKHSLFEPWNAGMM